MIDSRAMSALWSCIAIAAAFNLRAGMAKAEDTRVGLLEDCSTAKGWVEWDKSQKEVPPRVKMEAKDGLLYVHLNRGLLFASRWGVEGVTEGSVLRKNYGKVDLDKYHFLVVKIREKGSATFFGVNGFDTKAGFTTGTTAVDLKDYDDPRIHGAREVRLEMDLHDNLTTLVVEKIMLVSELSAEEKAGLIGRGLTIREEKLQAEDFHGLKELKRREKTPLPAPAEEEMAIFRDTATGAMSTRLTTGAGNSFIGEGEIWAADGRALSFPALGRRLPGPMIYSLADAKVTSAPACTWSALSPTEPTLLLVNKKGANYTVTSWDLRTQKAEPVAEFTVPEIGGYTELKRFTRSGKLIIAFRETPYFVLVDPKARKADVIKVGTRLKDAGTTPDEQFILYSNCYTYEARWHNIKTGEEGIASGYVGGHGCSGRFANVGSFGSFMKLMVPPDIFNTRSAGDKLKIWANWQNEVVTDYGSLTDDCKWGFTNGTDGDVKGQHVMVPSDDTGAVLRVARHFTKFSWESPTYSRPSPDYTKLAYCDNCIGPAQMITVYTRRTDPPEAVRLDGNTLSWKSPATGREIAGYNIYASKTSGRDFARINDKPVTGTSYELKDARGFFAVTAVEHSLLESMFSQEVTTEKACTMYFEAERQKLTAPARRFFDGYCNDFQCVRINAESPEEKARDGVIELNAPFTKGAFGVWARVKGKGTWTVAGKATAIDAAEWKWIKLCDRQPGTGDASPAPLKLSSRDDGLMLDTVMLTTEDFTPAGSDPRDNTPPAAITNLKAAVDEAKGTVALTWDKAADADFHHYSIYCGADRTFKCDNGSLIRSVFKSSITDAGMETGKPICYKVVAYDSHWNAGPEATVEVTVGKR